MENENKYAKWVFWLVIFLDDMFFLFIFATLNNNLSIS